MYAFLVVISIFFVVLCSNPKIAFVGSIELCRCTYARFVVVSWCCNVQDFSFVNVEYGVWKDFLFAKLYRMNIQCDNEDDYEDVND